MKHRLQLLVVVGASATVSAAFAQGFTDVTADSGIEAIRATKGDTNFWLSGLQLVDLDNDGDLDFFFGVHGPMGGLASLNDGRGHFTAYTAWSPTEIHIPYDLDEDGRIDVSLTENDGGGRWFLGSGPAGTLSFTKTMLTDLQSRVQFMVDINRDGNVDWLAVGAGSGSGAGPGTRVHLGDGKGGLGAATLLAGPVSFTDLLDVDGDGDLDGISARGEYPVSNAAAETHLYLNDGNMQFTEVTAQAGLGATGLFIHGWGDVDQDGDNDLIGLENNGMFPTSLFLNDGHGVFTKKAGAVDGPTRGKAVGANPGLATVTDLDNDGIADILIGGVVFFHVLHGTGGGNFTFANTAWRITSDGQLPDSAFTFGDIDGDGDIDMVGYKSTYPLRRLAVYRNDLPKKNWVKVRPVGGPGHKGAMGSIIRVFEAGTDKLLWFEQVALTAKQVQQNYYAFAATERHYGLGERATVDVSVQFYPSNKVVKRAGVPANNIVQLSEADEGTVVMPPPQPPLRLDAGAPADGPATGGKDAASPRADGQSAPTDVGAPVDNAGGAAGGAPSPAGGQGGAAGNAGDAGTGTVAPAVEPASSGCSCQQVPMDSAPVAAAPLIMFLMAWRRRRANRRAD